MKRHPSLESLSRDHHHALVMSQALRHGAPERLRAAYPREPDALIAALRQRFREELEPHFQVEERELIPLCRGRSEPLAAQAARVEREHHVLRQMLANLDASSSLAEQLDTFAQLLDAHVRFEERIWFPSIEDTLGADVLEQLASRLAPPYEDATS
jgi:iron-sulfur cluster repair protein YtfE (RIC family)